MIRNGINNESTCKQPPSEKMTAIVMADSIEAWEALPEKVRKDSSLQDFKVKYDELMGMKVLKIEFKVN